jgi:hypothetical protein
VARAACARKRHRPVTWIRCSQRQAGPLGPPRLAGRGSGTLFSDDAITLIHDTSRGLPRTVNNLCVAAPM